MIDDNIIQVDKEKYDSPFLLYVSSIKKAIKFYGKVGKLIVDEDVSLIIEKFEKFKEKNNLEF